MVNQRYQHDIIINDRSGSIEKILAGMQDGFNEFIAAQQSLVTDGTLSKLTASLWQFDDRIDLVGSFLPITDFAGYKIQPRGNTAMYDAIGRAIVTEGEVLAAMPEDERPGQVVVIVISDGQENWSKEWLPGSRVAALLEQQKSQYNWQVIYIGTNQDAFKEGASIGVAAGGTLSYANTSTGASNAWASTNSALGRYTRSAAGAGGQSASFSYSGKERAAAMSDKKADLSNESDDKDGGS